MREFVLCFNTIVALNWSIALTSYNVKSLIVLFETKNNLFKLFELSSNHL